MIEQLKKLVVPITAIIVLVIGNFYQGFSREELATLENALLSLGTAILGVIGVYSLYKKDKDKNE